MLRRVLRSAAAGLDRAVSATVLSRSRRARSRSRTESLGHAERMIALTQIRAIYDRPERYATPSPLFPEPRAIGRLLGSLGLFSS